MVSVTKTSRVVRDLPGQILWKSLLGIAVEIAGPQFKARHVAQTQHRSIRIGAHRDLFEVV
jgi:hypothetical protein